MNSSKFATVVRPLVSTSAINRLVCTYFYGTSQLGRALVVAMQAGPPWMFRGFIDSQRSGEFRGYPVLSIDEFRSTYRPGDQIIITSQYVEDITAILSDAGVPEAYDANPWNQIREKEELSDPIVSEIIHWLHQIFSQTGATLNLLNEQFATELLKSERYSNPLRVRPRIAKYFSSSYEDGMIEEIFSRIGTTNKYFVEFGVGSECGENNTLYLVVQGWHGLWMDISPAISKAAKGSFRELVNSGRLRLMNVRVSAENINDLFASNQVPDELDLLSIDIDGNDYWVWKALDGCRPRVVVIEYNAVLGPNTSCTIPYSPDWISKGSYYFGCSLKALEKLGSEKGYSLVGCDLSGVNAYFVRSDLTHNLFLSPFSAENHFEPMRYFLSRIAGHSLAFGDFVIV